VKVSNKGPKLSISEGDSFGRLTVIGYDTGRQKYICKCSCGSTKTTYAGPNQLKTGSIKSCGCLHGKRPSLVPGEKYNRLTVIDYNAVRKKYQFICDCGNISYAQASIVKNGKQKSCDCLRDENSARRMFKPEFAAFKNRIYLNYVGGAKTRGYEFNLSKEQVISLISKNCVYCGVEPSLSKAAVNTYKKIDGSELKVNGIDRVDNTKGYILENCVPCCYTCNRAKMHLSMQEWQAWLKRIIEFQTKS
jgi:hypothetical protein